MTLTVSADEKSIPARELADKPDNVVPSDDQWDGLVVCHGGNGMEQWTVDIKNAGPHYVHFQFASGEKRPATLYINAKPRKGKVLARKTGGFFAMQLDWATYGPYQLLEGKNTI